MLKVSSTSVFYQNVHTYVSKVWCGCTDSYCRTQTGSSFSLLQFHCRWPWVMLMGLQDFQFIITSIIQHKWPRVKKMRTAE